MQMRAYRSVPVYILPDGSKPYVKLQGHSIEGGPGQVGYSSLPTLYTAETLLRQLNISNHRSAETKYNFDKKYKFEYSVLRRRYEQFQLPFPSPKHSKS